MALDIFLDRYVKIKRSESAAGIEYGKHMHREFDKIIFVEKGTINVKIWDHDSQERDNIITAQSSVFIPKDVYRQIIVLEDSIFFKFYWRK